MLEIILIEYKKKNINNNLKKYHILNKDNKILKCKCCNLFSPFGREINKFNNNQHRFNIKNNIFLIEIIKDFEDYFKDFTELQEYNIISNIMDHKVYGKMIKFHLKINKNNTITPIKIIYNDTIMNSNWIDFCSKQQINIEFHPDCLWIDHDTKTYGISFVIDIVYQLK